MVKRLTTQQRKFNIASKGCQAKTKKEIIKDPRKPLFKTYGKCMKKALKK